MSNPFDDLVADPTKDPAFRAAGAEFFKTAGIKDTAKAYGTKALDWAKNNKSEVGGALVGAAGAGGLEYMLSKKNKDTGVSPGQVASQKALKTTRDAESRTRSVGEEPSFGSRAATSSAKFLKDIADASADHPKTVALLAAISGAAAGRKLGPKLMGKAKVAFTQANSSRAAELMKTSSVANKMLKFLDSQPKTDLRTAAHTFVNDRVAARQIGKGLSKELGKHRKLNPNTPLSALDGPRKARGSAFGVDRPLRTAAWYKARAKDFLEKGPKVKTSGPAGWATGALHRIVGSSLGMRAGVGAGVGAVGGIASGGGVEGGVKGALGGAALGAASRPLAIGAGRMNNSVGKSVRSAMMPGGKPVSGSAAVGGVGNSMTRDANRQMIERPRKFKSFAAPKAAPPKAPGA